ncbi:flagellar basal-body rod protein FlgF [Lutispora thermophila]|uniref:Flagellar basal-body rod protein FlgG n=1 Tax=Lutispora thermophila DSM 19022 TaxID=1122184 RepID=A0A1M6ANI7_9FIRM|nr:flagellar basal-body rod protein FlgF [Lutispora thermophila]SHI38060.1 flagellar basal-body rod protein FlgG [Lutispora thermophila DSM 19022]
MIRGLYISASSAFTEGKRIDTISNNIANVNTTGFKKDLYVTQSFPELLTLKMGGESPNISGVKLPAPLNTIGTMNAGVHTSFVFTDFSQGSHAPTNNPLDLAIAGNGFFTVETNAGERYTRDGSFSLDSQGYLVTKDGHRVLGEKGYIQINGEDIKINEKGEIYSNEQLVDRLKLVDFEDYMALMKEGNNLYTIISEEWTNNEKAFTGSVKQGYVEGSNVNAVKEMTEMITMYRAYEANQKLIKAHDELLEKAVNEVGRV